MGMLDKHHVYIDDIILVLGRYGLAPYTGGKSYGKYAKTINAITNWKPEIRRLLQEACMGFRVFHGPSMSLEYITCNAGTYSSGCHYNWVALGLDPICRCHSTDVVRPT